MPLLNLKTSRHHNALVLEKIFPEKFLYTLMGTLTVALAVLAVLRFGNPGLLGLQRTVGLIYLFVSLDFGLWVYFLFLNSCLKNFPVVLSEQPNPADLLDFGTAQLVEKFLQTRFGDVSALLLPISETAGCDFILYRIGDNPEKFFSKLTAYLKTSAEKDLGDDLDLLVEDAFAEVTKISPPRTLNWRDLLVTLSSHSDFFRNYLFELHLEKKDIRLLADWNWAIEFGRKFRKKFWLKENLMRRRGIAKDWASGFTLNLDRFALDLTDLLAKRGFSPHLYGRSAETEAIEQILARAGENNVVIVGDPGVGKKTIAMALAKKILDGETLPSLAHKRVLELDVGAILAGAASEHEVEARVKAVLNDAVRAGNVILLIDEIHSLFEKNPAPGTLNAAELLLPYLASSSIQIIGLTTYAGYHGTIAKNSSLLRAFEKVEIHEASKENVFRILQEAVPQIEFHDQVLILYQAMRQAVELTDRYIKNVPFPEKAISVLQQAAVLARTKRKSSTVAPEDIEEVVHQKTEIPVGKLALAEKEILLDLEKILHRKVIGQDDAISAIANALRRARSGIASEKKPIGGFLFLGPTGVGKTETAKALAEVYFGSVKRMIRFDMSEYQQPDSIHRLIGHDEQDGLLTNAVLENPFSLLLLDEIEKAHPNILNVFLQVLDDGRLTDALGRTADFTNTIIIATSNAGSELIRESIAQFREVNLRERLLDHLQKQGVFRPEFLNRFDAVIIYKPLTEAQTEEVVALLLVDLNRRLSAKDIQLEISPALTAKIAKIGYDPQFGARPLRRVIQDRIETLVAKKLLSGSVKRGETVTVAPEEI